jgi:hypothetical protein
MAVQNMDSIQATKISFFAKLWPLLLSGLVLIVSGMFCLLNLHGVSDQDFAIFAAHSNLMTFLRTLPNGSIPIAVIIWILAGIGFAIIARTIVGKIALLFSFSVAIPLVFVGYLFGLIAIPINT